MNRAQLIARCQSVAPELWLAGHRGIEKENLRVKEDGQVACDAHPRAFGAALTHPHITTDFAESLLELVTDPVHTYAELSQQLHHLNHFAHQHLAEGQLLWPGSMPGRLPNLDEIPIADYGSSHLGRMKRIYREGLVRRYGKAMQMIAGLHYNISFSHTALEALKGSALSYSERSICYMNLIHHFYTHYWILPYLFGASPVCINTSLQREVPAYLKPLNEETWIGPYATSLRNSEIGYQNSVQSNLEVSYDTVEAYSQSLLRATQMREPRFSKIGVKAGDHYLQLNDSILQIENEYYNPIRPKAIPDYLERPSRALLRRGIAYVEVRVLDLNPFEPLGLTPSCAYFMDVFMLMCLLGEPETLSPSRCLDCRQRFTAVVTRGRDPALRLNIDGQSRSLQAAARPLFDCLLSCAAWLDQGVEKPVYQAAVLQEYQKIEQVDLTPSARLHQLLQQTHYVDLMLSLGRQHRDYYRDRALPATVARQFQREAEQSLVAQAILEQESIGSFEAFLKQLLRIG